MDDIQTNRHRGVAMILVLVALSMATVIGLSFLNTQTTTNGIARNVSSQTRARGIAESAMEMTIDHLRTSDSWRNDLADGTWVGPESQNNQLDGGTFTIIVNDGKLDASGNLTDNDGNLADEPTDHVVVTAMGYFQGVSHTIKAEVTPEAGDVTPTRVVLIVGNESSPNSQEAARRAQLIDWGYEVTLVSANASQSRFDELAQETDVFWVSETISSGHLNDKLLNTGCGVVNEERALYDDFELTSGQANEYNDSRIELTDVSHYITASLTGQLITVFGQSQKMQYVGESALPSGAQVLATNPNNDEPALIVVEAGSALQEGTAAGRRVFLPWATNNLNFSSMNSNGLTVLKRSIEWAAQQASTPSPILHYDFSEQSGEVIRDKYGNVDMQLDRGDDDDAITWVTDPNGMGIQFNQDPDQGTAVCITSSPTDCEDLVEAVSENGAITVQVFFKQLNGSENGGYILSMANMAVEDDTQPVDDDDDGRSRHGRGHHGSRHGRGHHGGHHGLNTQETYTESVDVTNDPNTYIFYSYHGGHSSSNGRCGWSRRSSSRSDSYRVCYSRDRGYYYRRCGDDDDEDEVPEDAPDLYDNFSIDGKPNASAFNHGLYLSHRDDDQSINASEAWQEDTPIVYAFTFDAAMGVVSIYVNGELIKTEETDETDLSSWVSQWLTLGNSPSLSRPFVGTIYDVKIWPKALSASQLQDTADALLGDDQDGDTPNILVLYEFNEVDPVAPQLISQWKLNESTGQSSGGAMYGMGVSADDDFSLRGSAKIDGFRSSQGNYGDSNRYLSVTATTNATTNNKFDIRDGGTRIYGNALCGQYGNPNHVIDVSGSAQVTGSRSAQTSNVLLPDHINAPTNGRPGYMGNIQTPSNYNGVLDYNVYAGNLTIKSNAKVTVNGNITIWCNNFEIKDGGTRLYVPEGSSLTVYASGNVTIRGSSQINYQNNQTNGAGRVNIFTTDGGNIEVKDGGTVAVGNFYATGHLTLRGSAKIYGTASCSKNMDIRDGGTFLHVDLDQVGGQGGGNGGSNTTTAVDEKAVSDGTYTNGPITDEDNAKFDSAIKFDGDDDYIVMEHNDAYLINQGTISLWFKADDLFGVQALFSKDSNGYDTGGHFTIFLDNSTLKARLQSTGTSYELNQSGIATDTWYHVAVSFGSAGMKMILNGSIVDTDAYTGGLGTSSGGIGNEEPIVIGAGSMTSGNQTATPVDDHFNGWIDDVRIYGDPLTTTQIATVMSDGYPDADSAVGLVIKDTGGYGEPLDMTVTDPQNIQWDNHGGMTFTGPNRAVSDGDASKVKNAINVSGAMTVELIFTPDSVEQIGNIVSISDGAYSRNFTVDQHDEQYNIRLRTSNTDNNANPANESGDVLTVSQQYLVITWDGTTMKVYRNGQLESTSEHDGTPSSWSDSMHLVLGNEYDGSKPWEGFIERIAIYDQALNSMQVEDVFNGESPRANTQTQAMDFHVRWFENP